MSQQVLPPIAFLNGRFLPFDQARLPVYDLGVMQGATVTERMRTMRHVPYQVSEHLRRLSESLSATGIRLADDPRTLEGVIDSIVRQNTQGLPPEQDLAIVLFVTAGQGPGDGNGLIQESRPTVCAYTAPLPWKHWNAWWKQGVPLHVSTIRQVPCEAISPRIKHRSRLHWFLADQEARQSDPLAQAVLLDAEGFVTETSSGNLFVVQDGRLRTPRAERTLPGITQSCLISLAKRAGWEVDRADLTPDQVADSEEAFLTSSTYGIVPVSRIGGRPLRGGVPGTVTKALQELWSKELGFSLMQQILVNAGETM